MMTIVEIAIWGHIMTYPNASHFPTKVDQLFFFQRVTIFIIAMFKSWTHCPPTLDGPLDESP
jgi:hypothetical protein